MKNPHMIMTTADPMPPYRRYRCEDCGAEGTLDELAAIDCTEVHAPCETCGKAPYCAPDCAACWAVLGAPGVHVAGLVPVERDGQKVAVVRPDDPALAIRLARATVGRTAAQLDRVLGAQQYTFCGLLCEANGGCIINGAGQVLGALASGDSFVGAAALAGVPIGGYVTFSFGETN